MESLKKYLENRDWKEFESFISEVLENFGYKVERNVRLKFMRNKEFDIIAIKQNRMLIIECKRWKKEYSKFKNIKKEIEKFKKKVEEYKKYRFIDKKIYPIFLLLNSSFTPSILDDVYVLSLDFLNSFLLDLENLYI